MHKVFHVGATQKWKAPKGRVSSAYHTEESGQRVYYLCREIGDLDWDVCRKTDYESKRHSPEWDTARRTEAQVEFFMRRHHSLDWSKVGLEQYLVARADKNWETKVEIPHE